MRSPNRTRCSWRLFALGLIGVAVPLIPVAPGAGSQDGVDYTIGVRDVLEINVFNQDDLSGEYTVGPDGAFPFPLIGRVEAAGSTVEQLEETLRQRLLDGYFRDPRLSVAVAEFRSQEVFVMGEVARPGAYPLTAETNLVEILALAGPLTSQASGAAVVLRADEPRTGGDGPGAPAADAADTIRVNLRDIEAGDLSRNLILRDGDTVFIPRAEVVYVFGEVHEPGSYPIEPGMTVLQALALAGGATDFAALKRITVMRIVDGEQIEVPVQLDDPVQRDDTIRVPVKFF